MQPKLNINQPQSVFDNVVWFQYQSRYCSFLIDPKEHSLCWNVRHDYPRFSIKKKKYFDEMLVICKMTDKALAAEASIAKKKYGALSFETYFKQYIAPKMEKIVKNNPKAIEGLSCAPGSLPITAYRDPEFDVKLAIFAQHTKQYCYQSFKHSNTSFGRWLFLAFNND